MGLAVRCCRSNYGGGGGGRAHCLATHHTAARAVFLPSRSWLQNMVALPPGFQAPPRCSARQEGRAGAGWALHKLQAPLPSRWQEQGSQAAPKWAHLSRPLRSGWSPARSVAARMVQG